MNHEPSGPGARPSALVVASLLSTLHCNAILGIDPASCIGACGEEAAPSLDLGSAEGAVPDAGSASARSRAVPASDAGPSSDVPRLTEGAVSGALDTPLASDAGAEEPDLARIITSACAQQSAGESFCVVNYRVLCNADGAMASVSVCPDVERCMSGSGASCRQPVCTPGARRCSDERLEQCNAEGAEFVELQKCDKDTSCSPDEGCVGDACAAREKRCHHDDLQQCNSARTAFETITKCGRRGCDEEAGRCN